MFRSSLVLALAATLVLGAAAPRVPAQTPAAQPGTPPEREGVVRVGSLVYEKDKTATCFASGFLETVERQTSINVERKLIPVSLASDEIFDFPFVVMSGEAAFDLPENQVRRLEAYLKRGGFVLASAGCSSEAWTRSFRKMIAQVFPDRKLETLKLKHPLFHTIYDIEQLRAKQRAEVVLYGLTLDKRLVLIFSPLGLNDTANAGGGCCCCGGNEMRDAHLINANILAYALTR